MNACHSNKILSVLFSALLLISCGGGGGMLASGGIDGTGIISTGVVSAFGSIVVNGTEFDTSEAEVIIRGEVVGVGDAAVQENLEIGMVVAVEGRIKDDGSAFADRVIYRAIVNGPVESVGAIDPDTNEKQIVVLGQTVIVNVISKFKNTSFNTIAEDDVVEVSGYLDDMDEVRATFIEKTGTFNPPLIAEVTGFVTNLNLGLNTFEINDLTVNYTSIANDLPEGIPSEGLFVEVAGTLDMLGGVIIATEIGLGEELDLEDVDEIEIMGFVTEIISENGIIEFKIGNQEVHVDPNIAEFVDGDPGDIAPGQKLEAEGILVDGILIADEVEFWEPDQIEVEGIVDTVVFIGGFPEFTFEGGKKPTVQTDDETEFENIAKEDIETGLNIEVKGVPNLDHSIINADKVSLEED
jgi:hypothetical protein